MNLRWLYFLLLSSFVLITSCFSQDSTFRRDTILKAPVADRKKMIMPYILPATGIAYGVASLSLLPLKNFNLTVQRNLVASTEHPTSLDDYLQYVPALAGHVLSIAGIKGKHHLFDRLLIDAMAGGTAAASVIILKRTTNEERPDHSNNYSFPSGHVATAFASAELLRAEYENVSKWYGIGGYAIAFVTSYLRLYNNSHWFGDVVAGAGIGILSAKAANLVFPWVRKQFFSRGKYQDTNNYTQ